MMMKRRHHNGRFNLMALMKMQKQTRSKNQQRTDKLVQGEYMRIWGKKGFSKSKALYEIAAAPHPVEKNQEEHHKPPELGSKHNVDQETRALLQQMQRLSIQMKQDLETLQSRGASSSEQILSQQEAPTQQISKLTDFVTMMK